MLTTQQVEMLIPGDRILVECEVRSKAGDANSPLCDRGDVAIKVFWGGGEDACFSKAELIHTLLPRRITIGDKVRNSHQLDATIYEVISEPRRVSSVAGEQVALWSDGTGVASAYVSSLIRVRGL